MSRYTSQTVSGYNASPPPDDGSASADNEITWAKHKSKIGDPLLALAQGINSAVANMAATSYLRTVVAKAANYNIGAADIGTLFTSSAAITANLPAASTASDGFAVAFANTSTTNTLTIDADGSETIDGAATLSVLPNSSVVVVCNGTAWFSVGNTNRYLLLTGGTMTGALQNVIASESGGFGHISLGRGTGAGDRGLIVTSPDGSNGVSEVQIRIGSSIIARAIKSSERLRLLGAPADNNDAATKAYVDAATDSTDSSELSWSAGAVVTFDLGVAVKDFAIYLKCKNGSAISGTALDDLVEAPTYLQTTLRGIQGTIRGNTVRARVGSGGINLADGSGVPQTVSATDFPIIIRAWPR
jgi:hypothetical protein